MTDEWKQGLDEHGALCEYNMLTGDVRYPIDEAVSFDRTLTEEEIDALASDPFVIEGPEGAKFDPRPFESFKANTSDDNK